MLRADERADVGGRIGAGTGAQLFRFVHAEADEFFGGGFFDEKPLDGEADLAAIGVRPPYGGAGSGFEIGAGEDDHGVFAAKFEHGGNQVARASFSDTAAGSDAAGED